ncbi:MAG: hypothetical protein ABSA16_18655 [Thermoguttaceae bacterium]|jgi:hypothetical protein
MEILEAVKHVEAAKPEIDIRVIRRIEIGHAIQQGDVYLHRVPDNFPHGEQIGAESVQVALGTGNGARHMAEGAVKVYKGVRLPDTVRAPLNVQPHEVTGPVVVASDTWNLTHPEHPHHCLPAGTYQVTYQYDPMTMRRVQD